MQKRISGAILAIVLISWGVLLWFHFSEKVGVLVVPAFIGLIAWLFLETSIANE